MARNQATNDTIKQAMSDLEASNNIRRTPRTRPTARYSTLRVERSNVSPIKKNDTIKRKKTHTTNAGFAKNTKKISNKVKSGAQANVYYLKSAFNDQSSKRPVSTMSKRSKARTSQTRNRRSKTSSVVWNPKKRAIMLAVVMLLPLILVSLRLVNVQYLNSDRYSKLGIEQRTSTRTIQPERGTISDRNGNILAVSQPAWDIAVDPSLVKDDQKLINELTKLTVFDEEKLASDLKNKKSRFAYVKKGVDESTTKRVQAKTLPGITISKSSKREYPSGTTGANVVGFVGNDLKGLGGIEYMFNTKLSGNAGEEVIERDRQGREISQKNKLLKKEIPGQDISLTLDQGLQFEAERIVQEEVIDSGSKGGTAIVADIKTGEILSMVSIVGGPKKPVPAPSTDPNHAITDVYEPGSTNKVITIAGALESKIISPSTTFNVADNIVFDKQNFPDAETHAPEIWNAGDILRESSNVGTIMIASKLQRTRIDHYLRAFGYGKKTALNFPGEAPGILLDKNKWSDTSIATIPTGNGIAVTPIQMLSVYMTMANDGLKVDPQIVKSVVDQNGKLKPTKVSGQKQVISSQTANQLNLMLQGVVENGTGIKAAVPGYSVAGKTGTSRKAPYTSKKYIASFAGFAPASNPRIAIIVILDEPEGEIYGGTVAAPVFSRIMSSALRVVGVTPDRPTQGLSITNTINNLPNQNDVVPTTDSADAKSINNLSRSSSND